MTGCRHALTAPVSSAGAGGSSRRDGRKADSADMPVTQCSLRSHQSAWTEAGSPKEIVLTVTYTRMTSRWNECQAGRPTQPTTCLDAEPLQERMQTSVHWTSDTYKHPGN